MLRGPGDVCHALTLLCPLLLLVCCCSCDKKLLELGWQEKTPWEEGLKKTVDW